MKKTLIAAALMGLFTSHTAVASTETDELRKIIKQQQQVLADLEKRLEKTEKRVEIAEERVERTADVVETAADIEQKRYDNWWLW